MALFLPALLGCGGPEILFQGKPADHWIRQLGDRDPEFRVEAFRALGAIGADDERVVPALVERLGREDEKESDRAVAALKACGQRALPALVEALESPFFNGRTGAALALGELGAGGAPAVPALLAALRREKEGGRHCYVRALGGIGPSARDALPELRSLADALEREGKPLESLLDDVRKAVSEIEGEGR
ncbi:MAG: HEAT repeat domain-containing protein [Planctomycetes bacterium]|nr:HEAT repeat domain-containing protein [Planctomycetota bacterium]